jgi:ABC-type sugar transport system permease subunit
VPARTHHRTPFAQQIAPYLFLLPNLVIFGAFTIYPAFNGFNLALYNSRNGRQFTWAGFTNYSRILTDDEFWAAAAHTAVFVAAFVILVGILAILLALALNAQRWAKGYFRAVFFLPSLLSPVVIGLIWNWALNRQLGLVNQVLGALGLGQPGWLIDPTLAMIAIVVVYLWAMTGFYAVILLAGLQGIDQNVYDAAQIDGASPVRRTRYITLPLLKPTILVVLILSTINGFQAFDFIYTLTGGGPLGATTLIVQYIYEHAFSSPIRYGLASAAGVIFFVIVFACTLANFLIGRRREAI